MSDMFPWFDPKAPNCVDCPEHETRITPDPDDWCCDDDITGNMYRVSVDGTVTKLTF